MINLADVLALMVWSDVHCRYTVTDIAELILPPLRQGQFATIETDEGLQALATWAFLNPETSQTFSAGNGSITADDWRSGDQVWLMDVIAPFGHASKIVRKVQGELCRQGFKGHQMRFKRDFGTHTRVSAVKL